MSKEFDTFINLILIACEDKEIEAQLLTILRLPWNARNALLGDFVEKMKQQGAPVDFLGAMEWLKNDEVAGQVLEMLEK